jgi:hypothetical protein
LSVDGAKLELRDCSIAAPSLAGLSAARGAEIADWGSTIESSGGPGVYADERSTIKLDRTKINLARADGAHLARQSMMVMHKVVISGAGGAGVTITQGSEAFLSNSESSGNGRCGVEIYSGSTANLDAALVTRNQCGVAFYGEGRLLSQDGRFEGNTRGPLVYSDRWKTRIFLRGKGNQPQEFQDLFR